MKKNLDTCIHCGSSLRLAQSDLENYEPVSLPNGKALCGFCYKNMNRQEFEQYY